MSKSVPPIDRARLDAILKKTVWLPQLGPQLAAFKSKADLIFFGGQAGGGKSSLACGLALTKHRRTLYIRKESIQLNPVVEEIETLLGNRNGFNGQSKVWSLPNQRQITFGGVAQPSDWNKYAGSARDLLVVDECTAIDEETITSLMGWVRSAVKGQKCTTLLCSNPPSSAAGEWVIRWFAPWLDPNYEGVKAKPGELRWYANVSGEQKEVPNGDKFRHDGETIIPQSRTFIPSRVDQNKYLADSGYVAQLQLLPEPLRSQLLKGDFSAGRVDDEWQTIASADIEAAMARWKPRDVPGPITSLGCDPSRGGRDETIITLRHGWWFAPQIVLEGSQTGGSVAGKIIEALKGDLSVPCHIDSVGIGSSVIDHCESFGLNVVAINGAAKADEFATDISGALGFNNLRAQTWWSMRSLLSEETSAEICLPPSARLKADLASPRYTVNARGILLEAKPQIFKRLNRSPDYGDSAVYAATRTHTAANVRPITVHGRMGGFNTY